MKNLRLQKIINDNLRNYFNPMVKRKLNSVELNTNNTEMHEITKTKIAYRLIKNGHTILVEGKLKSGHYPDICVLDLKKPLVYEIMHTEKSDSILKKEKIYGMQIIPVHTGVKSV